MVLFNCAFFKKIAYCHRSAINISTSVTSTICNHWIFTFSLITMKHLWVYVRNWTRRTYNLFFHRWTCDAVAADKVRQLRTWLSTLPERSTSIVFGVFGTSSGNQRLGFSGVGRILFLPFTPNDSTSSAAVDLDSRIWNWTGASTALGRVVYPFGINIRRTY